MAATCIAPEVESSVEKQTAPVRKRESKPEPRFGDLVMQIFEGHEEFLGYTPD
jgi:hypothetical protein